MHPTEDLIPILKKLRLSGVLDSLDLRRRQAVDDSLSFDEFLYRLLYDEVERRDSKQMASRLRRANFEGSKTFDGFDFNFNPKIQKHRIIDLATSELDADAFAVQEIVAPDEFRRVLERASALTGRHYAVALEPVHFPGITETMHVGVVHDLAALELVEARLLGEFIRPRGQPAGMLALLRARDGRRLALASVHFSAGDTPARREDRVAQWSWLVAALPELRGEWAAPVIVAGDFNSTGYLVDGDPERRFIDALVEQHALQLPTAGLACSMYWQRSKTTFAVSLLDHVLAPGDLSFGPAEALGMCAELACAPQTAAPTAWVAVSDHCPVRVPLKF